MKSFSGHLVVLLAPDEALKGEHALTQAISRLDAQRDARFSSVPLTRENLEIANELSRQRSSLCALLKALTQ